MTLEQLLLLAIIQGLTEFLPISSSAHLILVPIFMSWPDQGPLIDVAIHVGSLFAVLAYFRDDTVNLTRATLAGVTGRRTAHTPLLLFLIVATIPTVVLGAVLELSGLVDHLRSAEVIAWTTVIFAIALYAGDRLGALDRTIDRMTLGHAIAVGLAQCIALIPGVSRSGITITMGRYLGYERREAARFSMLVAIPTIVALGVLAGLDVASSGDAALEGEAAVAALLSFLSAFASIWVFMRLLQRMTLLPFVIYRLIMGAGLLWYVYS